MGTDEVLYEEEPFHGITIKAGSVNSLLEYCLKNFGRFYYVKDYVIDF